MTASLSQLVVVALALGTAQGFLPTHRGFGLGRAHNTRAKAATSTAPGELPTIVEPPSSWTDDRTHNLADVDE